MKSRLYLLLLLAISTVSLLVVGLRGLGQKDTAYQIDGLSVAQSVQGAGLGGNLWSEDFGSDWQLSKENTTDVRLVMTHGLTVNVTFTAQPHPQDVTVSRSINVSMDQNPIVIAQVDVSQGIHYGIRFSGVTPQGTAFVAWNENSRFQHRPGLGKFESITLNLETESYLANNMLPVPGSRISKVWLYLEATIGTIGTFSMKMTSLEVFSLAKTPLSLTEVAGNLQAIFIRLKLPSLNESLFQAYVAFEIHGSPSLQYTPFLMHGPVVLAQGFTYIQNSITSKELAVLTTTLISGFPTFLPNENSTEIIFASTAGLINHFRLEDLSLKYTATPILQSGEVTPEVARFTLIYYFLFLFVTPAAALILVTRVFKSEG